MKHYIFFVMSFCLLTVQFIQALPTYLFETIQAPGFYQLASGVSNQITITTSNVTLDLNGQTVGGGTNGIVINSGLTNVLIKNGSIEEVLQDGIQINSGCSAIVLQNIAVRQALRGIYIEAVNNAAISNCDVSLNTTGIELLMSHNVYVENCRAIANIQSGFSLVSSTTCTFQACKALATGTGNTSIAGATANIFGFVSSNGFGNIFERCIANATQALTTTAANAMVAGFALRGTEQCSKIIGCEAANTKTSRNSFTVPYGVLLEARLDNIVTVTSINPDEGSTNESTRGADWSPDGVYLAVSGSVEGTTANDLFVYEFDRKQGSLKQIVSLNPGGISTADNARFVKWSPDGEFLALVGTLGATNNLIIYKFDRDRGILQEVASVNPGGGATDTLIGVDWTPDGKYLAVGGIINGTTINNDLFVYSFDRVAQTITEVVSVNPGGSGVGDTVETVQWSPDGNYLAVGGGIDAATGNDLYIYRFSRFARILTQVVAINPGGGSLSDTVATLSWSPDGAYLAVGGTINGNDLYIYSFDRTTETLTQVVSFNPDGSASHTLVSVAWSPDGNYLAIGGVLVGTTANDVFIYKFDRSTNSVTLVAMINPDEGTTNDTVFFVRWSPDGMYLAVGGAIGGNTGNDLFIYRAIQFPENNVILNNTVYSNSGTMYPSGVGISGSSIANLIISNVAYANPINPVMVNSNYQFVANVNNPLFSNAPTALQNISVSSKQPINSRYDIPSNLLRLEALAQSLVDNLL